MNGRTLFGGLALVVFLVVCLGLGGTSAISGANNLAPSTTQGEEIRMIQPPKNGIMAYLLLDKEAKAAQEVNVPNSQANLNNGQGRLANAQATLAVAKAEALKMEAARLNNEQFNQGKTNGTFLGTLLGVFLCIVGLVVVFGGIALLTSRAGGVG
jgi:hypothetical protein